MSIATEIQRLQTAKDNIKSAIEDKGVTVGDGAIDTYAEKIGEIEVGSGESYYDTFWDSFQNYGGELSSYENLFSGSGWNDVTFKPKYDIIPTTWSANKMFNAMNVVDFKACMENAGIKLDLSNVYRFASMFATSTYMKYIGELDFSQIDPHSFPSVDVFTNCFNLISIDKIRVSKTSILSYSRWFFNCLRLTHIIFEGEIALDISFSSSPKLDDESIQRIIDCLSDLTDSTAQTLTVHSEVGAKLTDEQKATITAKNWTLVY